MFAVVEFLEERGGCEVVPLLWVSGNQKSCKWPRKNVTKSVEEQVPPDSSWKSCNIKLVYMAESLSVARSKCSKYLETSNIDTSDDEDDVPLNGRNLRKRPRADTNEQEEFTFGLLNPEEGTGTADGNAEGILAAPVSSSATLTLPPPPVLEFQSPVLSAGPRAPLLNTPRRATVQDPAGASLGSRFSLFETIVLRKLERILDHVKDIQSKQNALSPSLSLASVDITGMPPLPLSTVAEMELFTALMTEAEENKIKMALYLARTGGSDVKDATERVLKCLMKDELAVQFNWCGKQFKDRATKLAIKITEAPAVVSRAVEAICGHADDKEVEAVMKAWLRNAKSRLQRK